MLNNEHKPDIKFQELCDLCELYGFIVGLAYSSRAKLTKPPTPARLRINIYRSDFKTLCATKAQTRPDKPSLDELAVSVHKDLDEQGVFSD